jgi:hypothetical protein
MLSAKCPPFLFVLPAVIGALASGEDGRRVVGLGEGNGDPRFDVCCFSSMARAFFKNCSIFSTRLVFFPPRQIKIADAIPQRKLAGIKIPVDHGGRSNLRTQPQPPIRIYRRTTYLSRPHMVPHRITWKMELPSLKQHIVKAVLSNSISRRLSAWPGRKHDLLYGKGSVSRCPVGSVPCLRLHELSLV